MGDPVTRAWTVRGGRYGQREEAALHDDLVIAGWEEVVADLSGYATVDELRKALEVFYPQESQHTINNWTHQLWRFCTGIQPGDLVVMPRKYQSVIAIGRVQGNYEYRADAPPGHRHIRPVEWLAKSVERAAVAGDLRDSMGSLLTVSELSRRNAVERVAALAETGADPGYVGNLQPPTDPAALKQEVDEVGTRQLTARDLIGLWGWSRRTAEAIEEVGHALQANGLTVEPHFTAVQLDGLVTVSALDTSEPGQTQTGASESEEAAAAAPLGISDALEKDLTWRIGNLRLVGVDEIECIDVNESLARAVMRMIEKDFSQLPVVHQHRRLLGVLTWESIARAQLGRRPATIATSLVPHPATAHEEEELFARIDDIHRQGFLIIVDAENVVTGLLTAVDLAVELKARIRPFTVLEEVERRLRRAVKLPVEDLRASFGKNQHRAAKVKSTKDLTLGAYPFVVDDDQRWARLNWPFERPDMVALLKAVAKYRNELAHWDVDAPGEDGEKLATAQRLLRLLKIVDFDPL